MKKSLIAAALGLTAYALAFTASAGNFEQMVGKWTWEGFTIDVTESGPYGLSAVVSGGPQNVGMEMIQSEMQPKEDGSMVGRVKHPANGDIYNSKMAMPDPDTWKMDGCTDGGACASGVFKRVH